jgi:hypothetical protein
MPARWIRNGDLTTVHAGNVGTSVTALKLYIAILSEVRSDNKGPGFGCAQISFSQLENVADVARAMITPALEFLEPWIKTHHSRAGNVYQVIDFTTEPGQWVRLPSQYILQRKTLTAFPSRSRVSLAALKMYLYLLERCERNATYASVSYPTIRIRTGIAQNDIPRAISALAGADLVRTFSPRQGEDSGQNVYHFLGFGQPESDIDTGDVDFD